MSGDNPRVLELRRRVQADPASIAFAQLAEECRRLGNNDDAVAICRAGLAHHPDYLSARVTLGRALVELGRLDEAQTELMLVLNLAPDNLPANRAIAEMYQTRGNLPEALRHYKRALELANYDPELEHQVERIENAVSPPPPPAPAVRSAPTAIEDLFDFDTLLEQLGADPHARHQSPPPMGEADAAPVAIAPGVVDAVELREDDRDPFSVLERQLRDTEEQRAREQLAARADETREHQREQRLLGELQGWLSSILRERNHPSA